MEKKKFSKSIHKIWCILYSFCLYTHINSDDLLIQKIGGGECIMLIYLFPIFLFLFSFFFFFFLSLFLLFGISLVTPRAGSHGSFPPGLRPVEQNGMKQKVYAGDFDFSKLQIFRKKGICHKLKIVAAKHCMQDHSYVCRRVCKFWFFD